MLTPKLQKLAGYKAKVEALEKSLKAERDALLRSLHTETGFASREELIAALQSLSAGAKRGRKPGKAASAAPAGRRGRKKRATITPELRNDIIAAVKSGGTGSAVAKKFGVSLPTVQNIKRDAGLTKKRKGK
jgi:DNA invertase Pin-like site-specific DNA recombinase